MACSLAFTEFITELVRRTFTLMAKRRTFSFWMGVFFLALAGCGGGSDSSGGAQEPPPMIEHVSVTPPMAQVLTGGSQLFTAQVIGTGAFNAAVSWSVNGVVGGNAPVGTIAAGQYTAPAVAPNPSTVTVTATS